MLTVMLQYSITQITNTQISLSNKQDKWLHYHIPTQIRVQKKTINLTIQSQIKLRSQGHVSS